MRQTYQKDKIIGRECGRDYYLKVKKTIKENVNVRVVPLLLLSLFMTVLAFTGTAAQGAVADDSAKLKVQEAYGKLPLYLFDGKSQMDSSLRHFEKGRRNTAYLANGYAPQSFIQGIKPEIRSHRVSPPPVFAGPHASAEAGAKPFMNGNIYPPYPDKTSDLRYRHEFNESTGFNLYSEQKLGLFTLREAATPENNIIYASAGGSISGRVTDSSGTGIQNVWVYVYDTNGNGISWAWTDANGNYTVTGIPTGVYKVQFYGSDLGYVNERYNNKPNSENPDPVPVTAPNTTFGIDAVLELGGSISGRVTDSTNAGIQSVWVYVYDTNGNSISSASTDANGNYTAKGIPTGVYKVRFYGSDLGYVNEWYNNKPDFGTADPVSVTAPNVTSGIDAVLEVGGSISGRVTDSSGAGIQNIGVYVYDTNWGWISSASTDANGNYSVIGITTGVYKVFFDGSYLGYFNEWYNKKPDFVKADPVPVTAPNATTGIDAVLELGGSISGRVTDSSGAGIQNVWVNVYDANWVWISGASTDANGNYTAMGIPTGAYKVEFYGSHLGYLYELYNNKLDFCNADPVAVTAPNATTGIDAVLELGGSISGRVTDSTGAGIQNVWVDIVNTNDEWISYASTDANGNYTAIGIPTGSYKVSFYGSDLGYVREWYNNKPDIGNADFVSVTAPNATTGIDAVLEVGGSISGRVTDSTGTGIQNVYVDIINTNGEWISWASTDANGNYTAGGVPTGAHKVRFYDWYLGYVNEWYNNKPDFGNADAVAVAAPNATTGIDAVLEPGGSGSISGRVTDSTGTGIQNAWVKVYDKNWGQWVSWAPLDANGNYIATGLSTGQYKVQFFYYGCSGYLSEWYNNKPDSGSADTVTVTAPNATVGIDAVLSVKTWFEENDPAITYTGTWKNYTCATCSAGAMKYSGQTGAKADFSFNGTGIKWIVTKANLLGKARVYLDGVNMGLVDLYNPTAKYQVVLQKTGLSAGNHTVTIEVSGQKNPASAGYFVDIDAFEVVP